MKAELILAAGAIFYVVDTIYDGKYSSKFTYYKKHFKIVSILFVTFSLYLFLKKNPTESKSLMSHLNGMVKYMPLDKQSKDLLTPFLSQTPNRILVSGEDATSRSVSGTKKKYVAANQGWKCHKCNVQLDAWYEIDHKVRLADGGSNHIDNLEALCRNCHGKKTTLENL